MKMILKIARAEFRSLFYSPIAWLIILAFYIVCGFRFAGPLVDVARIQEANLEHDAAWKGFPGALSVQMFLPSIRNVLDDLYLFIPLLTMGLISRELSTGTIRLLYSSPVRSRDIVLGKYLGVQAFSMILLAIVGILLATGGCTIIHAEYQWYLSILLGLFLLSGAYIAIGLFLSSLTSYQVVACILTFVVFFVFQSLRNVWQEYDFFRDITFFLAMSNKAEQMIVGIISTRDVFYFLIIIAAFLIFTLIKLKSTQESKSWRIAFARYFLVSITMLTVGYFSSKPGYVGYLDVTRNEIQSIHPNTQAVLKELDGSPLTVTLYTNVLGRAVTMGLPQERNSYVWNFWEKFSQFYPNLRYRYEYYYDVNDLNKEILTSFPNKPLDEVAASVADFVGTDISRFKKPEEIRKLVNLEDEDLGLIMELEYKGKKEFLRTYPDIAAFPEQLHISGTLRRLARRTVPKVYLTTGHYERSPYRNGEREYGHNTNFKGSRFALINLGVDVDTISLLHQDIPSDIAVLVVADPKSELAPLEKQKITDYINKGGNAIFYGEPGKQEMLNPLLKNMGVQLDSGTIMVPSKHELPYSFVSHTTETGIVMADEELLHKALKAKVSAIVYTHGGANISYQNTNGFTVKPILETTPDHGGWIERGAFTIDSAAPVFSVAEGDIPKSSFVTGVQLTRKMGNREQRIMVSGDADFMTPKRAFGGEVRDGMFSWTMYNEYPVYANYPDPIDTRLTISHDDARSLYVVYVYIVPAIVIVFATLLLIRRKRK